MKIKKLLKVVFNTISLTSYLPFMMSGSKNKKWQRQITSKAIVLLLAAIAAFLQPIVAQAINQSIATNNSVVISQNASPSEGSLSLFERGKSLYQAGQLREAVKFWEQAATFYQQRNDLLALSTTLNNLSLAYQGLGEWKLAETSINRSLEISRSISPVTQASQSEIARALDTSGNLAIALGHSEKAIAFWKEAESLHKQIGDVPSHIRNIFNQEQALKNQGFYRRSQQVLEELLPVLEQQPNSLIKAIGFERYGEVLALTGNRDLAKQNLERSQQILEQIDKLTSEDLREVKDQQSLVLVELGNIFRGEDNLDSALDFYNRAIAIAQKPITALGAKLSLLNLAIELDRFYLAAEVHGEIATEITKLPVSVSTIRARINYGESNLRLIKIAPTSLQDKFRNEAAQILAEAVKQSQTINDQYTLAYALGSFGGAYEQSRQIPEAIALTERALAIAQTISAPDIAYRWQWQLGRLLKDNRDQQGAIAAYSEAVKTLTQLRSDLAFINANVQFSFRESVEPVYRQFVSLLLEADQTDKTKGVGVEKQKNLAKAQSVIESLQLAELVNFFRADCLNAAQVDINKVDPQAAVIYPILLEDRLEVIASLPQQPLRHYATKIQPEAIDDIVSNLRNDLRDASSQDFLPNSQKLYDWLIRPSQTELEKSQVKTIVFVLDGSLRNIPMAVLNDGEKYLMEKYSIAVTPGLQLVDPKPIAKQKISALTGGLTSAQQGFSALPSVTLELQEVSKQVPSAKVFLDSEFTKGNIEKELTTTTVPIIHLATHGNFSSQALETFLLTYDSRLNIETLTQLLSARNRKESQPIELLILSACQTAVGDKRAALGMAGMAVRAGARSTIASLWSVDDAATSKFMISLYQNLAKADVTKAESLRSAQISLIRDSAYDHPYFWAPFVLLGNWL